MNKNNGSPFREYSANIATNNVLTDGQPVKPGDIKDGELAIAVLDRGWVFMGFVTHLCNDRIRIDCCYNIHKWGTKKGLGQLAIEGPQADTILNPTGPVIGKPIFLVKVDDTKW